MCVHSYLGVTPEETVWNWNIDVKVQRLQDADLHGDELGALVGIIANIKEIVYARWSPLLSGHTRDVGFSICKE